MLKTLYVNRPLLNDDEIHAWAKSQGFESALAPGDMHTTIIFSKTPIEWNGLSPQNDPIICSGGKRFLSCLGDYGKAVVLQFESFRLSDRWAHFRSCGASWDYEVYKPHITITYNNPNNIQLKAEPFYGSLIFGPERFKEVDTSWKEKVKETSLKSSFWQRARDLLNI